ncbi:ATP-binding cassette sub-family B member 10, mitochondrial-like isoform X2 [Oscarella lobularis]|uniref:ATP-binding cassette sub-family B member 10, mitochondrial-like isoform X2 n=1 Tax=Oscarella lobularis TaxID=121494 RepID=UPI003313B83E
MNKPAVGLLFVSSAVTMSVPFCMGRVVDAINVSDHERDQMRLNLTRLCQVFGVIFCIGAAANCGRIYLTQTSGQRIIKRLRDKLFGAIVSQEIAFFDRTRTGELINRLSTDTTLVGKALTENLSGGLRSLIQAGAGVSMMFYLSSGLAMVVLGIVPPIAVLAVVYGRFMRSITRKVQDALAVSTEVAEEKLSSIRTVRALGVEAKERQRYGTRVHHVLQLANKEALARAVFFGFTGLTGNVVVLSVLYKGGLMMEASDLSVGDLTSFLLYTGWVGFSIGGLSSFYTELMKGLGASTRLWQLIDRVPTIPLQDEARPGPEPLVGNIDFTDVSFAYPTRRDAPVLANLSLSVPSGSVTAIVGASGSGKSTLAALLLRFYDVDAGAIAIDGVDVRDVDPAFVRRHVGVVAQEPVLFSTSIAENIAYGSAVAPDDVAIREAADKANAIAFIESFPDGFETTVGERGQSLSGGQRQRIAIARALVKNPKILILDEATSALDAESEHAVQEALQRLMTGRTVLTIAHRLSTIKNAHQIAVLDGGRVAELGTYDQLVAKRDGIFRRLVDRQTIVAR